MTTFVIIKTFVDGTVEQSPFLQAPSVDSMLEWIDNIQMGIEAYCDVSYKIIEGV